MEQQQREGEKKVDKERIELINLHFGKGCRCMWAWLLHVILIELRFVLHQKRKNAKQIVCKNVEPQKATAVSFGTTNRHRVQVNHNQKRQ